MIKIIATILGLMASLWNRSVERSLSVKKKRREAHEKFKEADDAGDAQSAIDDILNGM